MHSINTISLAPTVNDWLVNTRQPQILHIFDRVCNLINEHREVLSVVTSLIGNGPFNLMIEEDICFTEHLDAGSSVFILEGRLQIGDLVISMENAEPWNPRPDWELLYSKKEDILSTLRQLPIMDYLPANQQISKYLSSNLCSSLVTNDISTAKFLAAKLAGLGIGLTPSGDDFIIGAIYTAWIVHPYKIAGNLVFEIAEIAAASTTSLSGAHLKAAGRGEAGVLWHNLFNALLEKENIQLPIARLFSVGATSGADALAGFFGVMSAFKERIINECPS